MARWDPFNSGVGFYGNHCLIVDYANYSFRLYWVGLLEWSRPGVALWYFHRDLLSGDEEYAEAIDLRSID